MLSLVTEALEIVAHREAGLLGPAWETGPAQSQPSGKRLAEFNNGAESPQKLLPTRNLRVTCVFCQREGSSVWDGSERCTNAHESLEELSSM